MPNRRFAIRFLPGIAWGWLAKAFASQHMIRRREVGPRGLVASTKIVFIQAEESRPRLCGGRILDDVVRGLAILEKLISESRPRACGPVIGKRQWLGDDPRA